MYRTPFYMSVVPQMAGGVKGFRKAPFTHPSCSVPSSFGLSLHLPNTECPQPLRVLANASPTL